MPEDELEPPSSNNLERNGKLETGLQFLRSVRSSSSLFSTGRTMASLNSAGIQPVVSDLLVNKATGESSPLMSLTSHVGAGSSWHVLFGVELISFATSSTVTAVKSASDDVTRREVMLGLCNVQQRRDSRRVDGVHLVSLKYLAKSSAESGLSSSWAESPSTPWSVRLRADRQHDRMSCKGTVQVRDAMSCRGTNLQRALWTDVGGGVVNWTCPDNHGAVLPTQDAEC